MQGSANNNKKSECIACASSSSSITISKYCCIKRPRIVRCNLHTILLNYSEPGATIFEIKDTIQSSRVQLSCTSRTRGGFAAFGEPPAKSSKKWDNPLQRPNTNRIGVPTAPTTMCDSHAALGAKHDAGTEGLAKNGL